MERRAKRIRNGLILAATVILTMGGPAIADTTFEERLDLAPGGSFELDVDRGRVDLRGGSSEGVVVIVKSTRDDVREKFEWKFESDGNTARVVARRPASERGFWGWLKSDNYRLSFEVTVPTDTEVTVDTSGGSVRVEGIRGRVDADTSGGKIELTGIEGEVNADTSGGSIRVENITGDARLDTSGGGIEAAGVRGSVWADTSGGSIRIDDVEGDARADTSGGSISMSNIGGRVEADTSGGSVRVSLAPGNSRGGTVSTSGGRIEVHLDPSASLDIDAECSGGGVRTDLPITVEGSLERGQLRGRLNGGGATLKLRGSGGGIRIEPL
jgi:hypothetical protein